MSCNYLLFGKHYIYIYIYIYLNCSSLLMINFDHKETRTMCQKKPEN